MMITFEELWSRIGGSVWLGREKLEVIYHVASGLSSVPGDIAEVGVYKGGTLAALALMFPKKIVRGFDTFSGMPETSFSGEGHHAGDFSDTSVESVTSVFQSTNFELHPGRFPETAVEGKFAFVHVDGDYYETTRDAIDWFWPRMSTGGRMLFDDFRWPACPGVERALNEAIEKYGFSLVRVHNNDNDQVWIQKK